MSNPFDEEGKGERDEREKRERQRAEIENAVRDRADQLRSSELIANHYPQIEVSAQGGIVVLRNTRSNETRKMEYLLGGGWSVQTDAGMFPGPEDFVISEIQAWVNRQS